MAWVQLRIILLEGLVYLLIPFLVRPPQLEAVVVVELVQLEALEEPQAEVQEGLVDRELHHRGMGNLALMELLEV